MPVVTNPARLILSNALMAQLVGATAKIGTGRYSSLSGPIAPVPTDTDLQTPVQVGLAVDSQQFGEEILITVVAPQTPSLSITEIGIFQGATALVLESFAPVNLNSAPSQIRFTLLPAS
jgi:hypothetical protein